MNNQTIEFAPWQVLNVQVKMCPEPSGPVDDWSWVLTIRDKAGTIMFQTTDFTVVDSADRAECTITQDDTGIFDPGEYVFDVWRTSPSPGPVASGICVVLNQQWIPSLTPTFDP